MSGNRRRNQIEHHVSEANNGDVGAEFRLDHLRRSFAKFRRAYRPRTQISHELREAALEALRRGATELEVRRACRITPGDSLARRMIQRGASLVEISQALKKQLEKVGWKRDATICGNVADKCGSDPCP